MTTKSQEAFEVEMLRLNNNVIKREDGSYVDIFINPHYRLWKKAEAYGRKQALEEAVAIANTTFASDIAPFYIAEKIKELIK